MVREYRVDVSDLEPPEPMQRVLAALRELEVDTFLVMCHRRVPRPLFAMLIEMGYCYRVRLGQTTEHEIVIWPADSSELSEFCGPADAPNDGSDGGLV